MTVAVKRQMHQNFLPCNTVCWCWNSVFWNRFFSTRDFFHRHWRFTGQQGKGRGHFLFHYTTTSTRLRTFVCFIDIYLQHLFATLHVRWLSCIFNRNACVYQMIATRWELPPYRITIWLIDWWCNVCSFTWWIDSRFLLQQFWHGKPVDWTPIDYYPCITKKPTNQVKIYMYVSSPWR